MKHLPPEILNVICEYAGVKCRNGKYMNQISKTDPRLNILRTIPQKQFYERKNKYGDSVYNVIVYLDDKNTIDYFEMWKNDEENCNFYDYKYFTSIGFTRYTINTNKQIKSYVFRQEKSYKFS